MTDWEGVHTCHTECPCQTGGEPAPDFIGSGDEHDPFDAQFDECRCRACRLRWLASPRQRANSEEGER